MSSRADKTRSITEILEDSIDRKELHELDKWIGETLSRHIERLLGSKQPTGYISRLEAAKTLGVSTQTVDRLISEGVLKARKVGRRVTVSQQSIDLLPLAEPSHPAQDLKRPTKSHQGSIRTRGAK